MAYHTKTIDSTNMLCIVRRFLKRTEVVSFPHCVVRLFGSTLIFKPRSTPPPGGWVGGLGGRRPPKEKMVRKSLGPGAPEGGGGGSAWVGTQAGTQKWVGETPPPPGVVK